jgi:photosynthetic reaction center cytochrome c subunit
MSALPLDPLTPFLDRHDEVRVQGTAALPNGPGLSIKQAEWTYALMMHFSQALGVNCNFCHNTRAMWDWAQSPPQRTKAWHAIRMVRDLNNNYLDPLQTVLPNHRLGPALGDAPKVSCATCHNGVHKPLFGVSMVQDFPELKGPGRQAVAAQ